MGFLAASIRNTDVGGKSKPADGADNCIQGKVMARPRNTPEVPANMMNLIPVPAESRTKKEMSLKHYAVFHWFTTPDELRRLADEMEEHWLTCAPGQDKTVKTICGKNELLHIIVDQDNIKSPGWYARKKQC